MMPKKEFAYFIRYLKDKGLYSQFKHFAYQLERRSNLSFNEYLEKTEKNSAQILLECILLEPTGISGIWHSAYLEYRKIYTIWKK